MKYYHQHEHWHTEDTKQSWNFSLPFMQKVDFTLIFLIVQGFKNTIHSLLIISEFNKLFTHNRNFSVLALDRGLSLEGCLGPDISKINNQQTDMTM